MDATRNKFIASIGLLNRFIILLLPVLLCSRVGEAYTIQQAIARTLKTHPDIMAQVAAERAAQHDISVVKGQYFPSVDIGSGIGREQTDNPGTRASGNHRVTLTRKEADGIIRQLIFDGGSVSSQLSQSKANLVTSQYEVTEAQVVLAFDAAQAFLNVKRNRELVNVAKKDVAAHHDLYVKVERRFKAGAGRKSEVQLARSRLALADSRLERARGLLQDANAAFEKVVGIMAPKKLDMPTPLNHIPTSLSSAQSLAMGMNPSLAATRSEVDARKAQIGIAKSEFWPTFNLELSTTVNSDLDGVKGHSNDYQAMVRMDYNIFNGGSDRAAVSAATQRTLSAQHDAANISREINEDVAISWNTLQAELNRIPHLRTHKEESYNVSLAYVKQFQLGQRTLFDLLNSATEYFSAWSGYINGVYDADISRYRLLASIGNLVSSTSYVETPDIIASEKPMKHNSKFSTQKHFTTQSGMKPTNAATSKAVKASAITPTSADSQSLAAQLTAQVAKNTSQLPANDYGIQLLAARNIDSIKDFIKSNHLQSHVKVYHRRGTSRESGTYYIVYGDYASKQQAKRVLARLPQNLQKLRPIVLSHEQVESEIS